MVFAVPVDQSSLPGGASLQVDGGSSNAFNGESYVSFQLSPGAHQVALTLPDGYRTEESPVAAGQVQNPDSPYGNPRNIVSDDISVGISGFTTFKLFPLITVQGSIRNRWSGLPVSGARITATALSGPLAGLSFDQWPYEADYATAWETDTDGEFPDELLLIAGQDYQLTMVYSNYTTVITNIPVAGIPPGGTFDSGQHWQTPLDSNVNGIEDAWEYENFGSLIRSTADVDRDGHDNETEFRLGTDPNSPDSVLAFDTLDVPGEDGSIMLYWPVAANRIYEVSALTNLVSDNWIRVFGPWTAPSNGIIWWADTNAVDKATRTYRIGVILP